MVSSETEIRRLRPVNLCRLAELLSPDLWKTVMGNIEKPGSPNVLMFTSEHIAMIQTAATKERKLASEIFLDEWGTMGRERPTIKTAIDLLVKAELFRAADYLAVELMKGSAPNRPANGPAAVIEIPADIAGEYHQAYDTLQNNILPYRHATETIGDNDVNNSVISHYPISDTGIKEVQFLETILKNCHDDVCNAPPNSCSDTVSDLIEFSANRITVEKKTSESMERLESRSNAASDMEKLAAQSESFLPKLSAFKLDSKKHLTMQQDLPACNLRNFPQELGSSELPLCINDRTVMSSYHESSCEVDCSITCTSSSDSHTNTSDNFRDHDLPRIPTEHNTSHNHEFDIQVKDIVGERTVEYKDLPLTVVELCQS